MRKALDSKKLFIILDLDHTLVHATVDMSGASLTMNDPEIDNTDVRFVHNDRAPLAIKLRNHIFWFLFSLKDKYEFSIYTAGTELYGKQVASFIDPTGTVFSDRIYTRDDSKGIDNTFFCFVFFS